MLKISIEILKWVIILVKKFMLILLRLCPISPILTFLQFKFVNSTKNKII